MRIVVMGTGPFAVPLFEALCDSPHDVLALVTQPPRDARGKSLAAPMREAALARGLPVLDPLSINTAEARAALARFEPDLFVVADYGQILSPETLAIARHGGVNLHGSVLPKYRGAAPIAWALYNGDLETGVTVIHMTPRVDAGPCLCVATTPIDPDENAVELEARLSRLGAPLVCRAVDDLAAGRVASLPQDPALATPARRLRKSDARLDWSRSAVQLKNQIRAFEPWPRNFTHWLRTGEPLRMMIGKTSIADQAAPAPPGTVLTARGDNLIVATGAGGLALHEVQPASKRLLGVAEFLRGYPLQAGDRLGDAG